MSDHITPRATEELLPCPFCGYVGLLFEEGSTFRWLIASCHNCGATCGEIRVQTLGEGTQGQWRAQAEQEAVAAWNTRAEAKQTEQQLRAEVERLTAKCDLYEREVQSVLDYMPKQFVVQHEDHPFATLAISAAKLGNAALRSETLAAEVERLTKERDNAAISAGDGWARALQERDQSRATEARLRSALERVWFYFERVEWKPIETAPKDATEILILEIETWHIGKWACAAWRDRNAKQLTPTHWLPLPLNPKPESKPPVAEPVAGTPRTDAECESRRGSEAIPIIVSADFARTLERELIQATAALAEVKNECERKTRFYGHHDPIRVFSERILSILKGGDQ